MTFNKFVMEVLYPQSSLIRKPEEQQELLEKKVYIAGIGGNGSGIINILGRLGIGYFCISDPDNYCYTNLNRQFLASKETIGKNKAIVASELLSSINPYYKDERLIVLPKGTTLENYVESTKGYSVIINQPDTLSGRLMLDVAACIHNSITVRGARKNWPDRLTVGVTIRDYKIEKCKIEDYYNAEKWGVEELLLKKIITNLLNQKASQEDLDELDLQNMEHMKNKLLETAKKTPEMFGHTESEYLISRLREDPFAFKQTSDPILTGQTALLISIATYKSLLGINYQPLNISLHRGEASV